MTAAIAELRLLDRLACVGARAPDPAVNPHSRKRRCVEVENADEVVANLEDADAVLASLEDADFNSDAAESTASTRSLNRQLREL